MAKNKKGKKNHAQQDAYRNFIKHSSFVADDTDYSIKSEFLLGSDNLRVDSDASPNKLRQKYKPVPLGIRAKKWIEKNGLIALFISLAISFVVWSVINIFGVQKDVAVLSERVTNLVDKVDELSMSTSAKDMVEVQLNSIRQELQQEIILSTKDIEARLKLIEIQIDNMSQD